jgi:hypothetical protein
MDIHMKKKSAFLSSGRYRGVPTEGVAENSQGVAAAIIFVKAGG